MYQKRSWKYYARKQVHQQSVKVTTIETETWIIWTLDYIGLNLKIYLIAIDCVKNNNTYMVLLEILPFPKVLLMR